MMPKTPRKNSRQWFTIIALIEGHHREWIDDTGHGHAALVDDVSRLRDKGWIIEEKEKAGFSKSYRLDRSRWVEIKDNMGNFWR